MWAALMGLAAACAGSRLNPHTPMPVASATSAPFSLATATATVSPPTPTATLNTSNSATPSPTLDAAYTATPVPPPRLLIPSLNVDEAIVTLPLVNGEWDLTPLAENVGWLESTGARPGAEWAMVLTGHVSRDTGLGGPFADLQFVRREATVIYRAEGFDYVYAVREKMQIEPADVKRLFVRDGSQLLLVTCTNWDFIHFEYDQRLLVRAELVEQRPSP
jgi:LPXTG-site transpeptidase (sortase) family protein